RRRFRGVGAARRAGVDVRPGARRHRSPDRHRAHRVRARRKAAVRRACAVALLGVAIARPVRADVPKALSDFKAGRYMEAAAELQALLDRSPGDAYAYFLLGHCLLRMQHPDDAEKQFKRAIEIDPTKPEYFQGLALALKTSADWQHAIQTASDGLTRAADPG